jgi:hypothetical protein
LKGVERGGEKYHSLESIVVLIIMLARRRSPVFRQGP